MRKLTVTLALIIALFLLIPANINADTGTALNQEVPFGLTKSEDGQFIPVFEDILSSNKTGLLLPDQLCALDYSTIQGKYYWYHIIYLDEEGEPRDGYVKESNFQQLSLTDYTDLLLDSETRDLIDQYLALSESSPLFQSNHADISSANGAKKQQYILNTNTHKFHYPDCKSVKKMKEKNKKPYTGTREEILEMGYVPCKNCNP